MLRNTCESSGTQGPLKDLRFKHRMIEHFLSGQYITRSTGPRPKQWITAERVARCRFYSITETTGKTETGTSEEMSL